MRAVSMLPLFSARSEHHEQVGVLDVRDDIIPYSAMVGREGLSLQKGMNFRVRPGYSILLMSMRENAPYHDRWDEEKQVLLYQGHDVPNIRDLGVDPKTVDQPMRTPNGGLTENGKFYTAAKAFAEGGGEPERVRVYEKIKPGIWSDKGMFLLVDAAIEEENGRKVFVFMLQPLSDLAEAAPAGSDIELPHRRLIPTHVKVEVWKRDNGQCVLCGATTNLHFDHNLPFSKGGSSLVAENVQLLCAKHNLQKSDRIE